MTSKYDSELSEDEDFSELPKSWPDDEALSSDCVYFMQTQDEMSVQQYKKYLLKNSGVYPMKHFPRGNVLVINNERFPHPHERKGTGKDMHKINAVFSQIGFSVIVYNNLTKDDMEETLLKASKDDYSNHDCLVIFILSHGNKGIVYGIDGNFEDSSNSLSISDITKLFSDNESLFGKPKLFFIQACQGSERDKGITIDDESNFDSYSETNDSLKTYKQNDSPHSGSVVKKGDTNDEEEIPDGLTIPSKADIFVSTASVEGYVSWRDTKYGSWYVQAIGYVFRRFAYKLDLHNLMTKVNGLVSKLETKRAQFKQVAAKYDTLTKTFYFCPCLHEPYVEIYDKYQTEKAEKDNLKRKFDIAGIKLEDLTRQCNEGKTVQQNLITDLKSREKEIDLLRHQIKNEKTQSQNLKIDLVTQRKEIEFLRAQLKHEHDIRLSIENELDSERQLGSVQQLLHDLKRQSNDIGILRQKLVKENDLSQVILVNQKENIALD